MNRNDYTNSDDKDDNDTAVCDDDHNDANNGVDTPNTEYLLNIYIIITVIIVLYSWCKIKSPYVSYSVISYHLLSFCLVLSRLSSSCLFLSCLSSSCFILSRLSSSCLVLSCLSSSCLDPSRLFPFSLV